MLPAENMPKEKNLKLARMITENIIKGTLGATAWILMTLLEMGASGIDVFLNPSPYRDHSVYLFENFESKGNPKRKKEKPRETAVRQSLWRLRKLGFVEKRESKYFLTKAGRKLMQYVLSREKAIRKKWDGKYRVVIFDIPEKKRRVRDWLRSELYLLNYKKLQKSVFVGKHPLPSDLIEEIKSAKIGNCVNYLLLEKVYKNII